MVRVSFCVAFICCFLFTVPGQARQSDTSKIQIKCRIVDLRREPVTNANVRVVSYSIDDIKTKTVETITSDSHGFVETQELPPKTAYYLVVEHPEFQYTTSRATHVNDSGIVALPDVVLRGVRTLTGNVKDAGGKPLADVLVFCQGDGPKRAETRTDKIGDFELAGFPEGPAALFFEKESYWFTGSIVTSMTGDAPVIKTLTSRDRPNPEQFDPDYKRVPDAAERILAEEFVPKAVETAIKEIESLGPADQLSETAKRVREFHTRRVSMLDKEAGRKFSSQKKDLSFYAFLYDIDRTNPELVFSWINSSTEINNRVSGIQWFCNIREYEKTNLVPISGVDSGELNQQLCKQAIRLLPEVRREADLAQSIYLSLALVDVLHRSGDSINARKLTEECIARADSLKGVSGQMMKSRIAESLATQGKVERSIEFAKELDETQVLLLSYTISRFAPNQAFELIKDIEFDFINRGSRLSATHGLPQLCNRAAALDTELALRFADKCDTANVRGVVYPKMDKTKTKTKVEPAAKPQNRLLKAKLLAIIGARIANREPKTAKQLVTKAIDDICNVKQSIKNPSAGFIYTPALYLASVVPQVASVDRGLAAESSWRALSIRKPRSTKNEESQWGPPYSLAMHQQLDPDVEILLQWHMDNSARLSYSGEANSFFLTSGGGGANISLARRIRWAKSFCENSSGGSAISPRVSALASVANDWSVQAKNGFLATSPHGISKWIDSIMWIPTLID